jgi:3-hydroxybutyryl-CoA dehydrogenase
VGFRMGPCELMDLIGHDTNFAVTNSVYEANFFDKRYAPSGVQRELVDAGWLGRKSGCGFYRYPDGASAALPATATGPAPAALTVSGRCSWAARIAATLQAAGVAVTRDDTTADVGLHWPDGAQLWATDGRTASHRAAASGRPNLAVFDWSVAAEPPAPGTPLAFAVAASAAPDLAGRAAAALAAAGWQPVLLADAAGLVVARTVAMLINEAADAVQQGVCTPDGADLAMKLGVNYPAGPFEWLARVGVAPVVLLLDALDAHYGGERYRVSPWLRQRAWAQQAGTANGQPAGHGGAAA